MIGGTGEVVTESMISSKGSELKGLASKGTVSKEFRAMCLQVILVKNTGLLGNQLPLCIL